MAATAARRDVERQKVSDHTWGVHQGVLVARMAVVVGAQRAPCTPTTTTTPTLPRRSRGTAAACGGWTSRGGDNIDAIVALAMAVERAEARPEPARVLGWL